MYRVRDIESGQTQYWTLEQIINEINRDRGSDWADYNYIDWLVGWNEWVEGQVLELVDKDRVFMLGEYQVEIQELDAMQDANGRPLFQVLVDGDDFTRFRAYSLASAISQAIDEVKENFDID